MPRIRTVKPELWTDPDFVECSSNARLLFIAALNFASDYGVLADKPRQLKMLCFAGDDLDVEPLMDELVDNDLWIRTRAPDGAKVVLIRTFSKHQKIDRINEGRWGNPATWPDFADRSPRLADHSSNVRGPFDEASPPEGKGREGKGRDPLQDGVDTQMEVVYKPVEKLKVFDSIDEAAAS